MFQVKLILCNLVLWLSLLPASIRFVYALAFPRKAQGKVLEDILGRRSMSYESFLKQAVTSYADYADDIRELMRTGTHPHYDELVVRLCPTSGTSGQNKLIPYTQSLKDAFQAGLYPWIFFMYLRFPRLFFARQYWSVTPVSQAAHEWPESKVRIGFEDDASYIGALQRLITQTVWVETADLAKDCVTVESFLNQLALRLSTETHLGLISVWSPSLSALLVEQHGTILPHNAVLSAWAHGQSRERAVSVAKSLHAELQPKGLLSTEACVTIPFGTQTFFLSYNSHFFEFRETDDADLLTAERLEVGHEYEVVLTTQNGFLRYATGDRIRVTKKVFGRPSCVFVGRTGVVDLFGEKLDEGTVEHAVSQLGVPVQSFWFVAPTEVDGVVAYTLFLPESLYTPTVHVLDQLLSESYHYGYCRELGQLAEARIFVIKDLSPEARFIELSAEHGGARLGDVKIQHLVQTLGWEKQFNGQFAKT